MTTERYESSPRDTQEIERLEASLCDLCLPRVIMFMEWCWRNLPIQASPASNAGVLA